VLVYGDRAGLRSGSLSTSFPTGLAPSDHAFAGMLSIATNRIRRRRLIGPQRRGRHEPAEGAGNKPRGGRRIFSPGNVHSCGWQARDWESIAVDGADEFRTWEALQRLAARRTVPA